MILLDLNDFLYKNRVFDCLEKYCEYVLRIGFFENLDMIFKDVINLLVFWVVDDMILFEVE